MRIPTDLPRRRRQPRGRIWVLVAVAAVFIGLTSLRGLAGFYTDFLWFDQLGFGNVFTGVLGAKVLLALGFTALFFVALWLNLFIADRLSPGPRLDDDELAQRYREAAGRYNGRIRAGVALVFALLAGTGVAGQWNNWLQFRNGASFGTKDPQFHRDIGFYMFKLPFLSFLVNWTFVAVVIIAVVTVFAHYLNGGIRLQAARDRVSPQVKAHISVLLGVLALVKAAGYWLATFELNFSHRGVIDGASYTDVKAQLPAIRLLILISLVAVVLFLVNIRRQGWVLPGIAVGLWAFVAIIVGSVYPAFIQKFRVEPQENKREAAYISRNIAATRQAIGIDKVKSVAFPYSENLDADALDANADTVRNVRLWDPDPRFTQLTYQKLQGIRSYYKLQDVDIDRYDVDGQVTQTLVAVREIDPEGLPSDSWINRHLQYTHGYGAVLAPANAVDSGRPSFLVKDVPPQGTPKITEPRVYFGESSGGYAIVNTKQKELDYQSASGTSKETTYTGKGGVEMKSIFRRAAYALRFGNLNPLISNLISNKSRAIYIRDIGERVRKAAPFLRYDSDPYAVILDGRILWVQDAYSVSSRYPYAQRADTDRIPENSGLRTDFNYVRNSVKAVIDGYDGNVTFYVMDDKDPIVKTYAKAFPKLFTPGSRMDPELRRHLRYPEDLFRLQTNMFGRYHITDSSDFYNASDAWNVSQDPGSGSPTAAVSTATETNAQGLVVRRKEQRMDPTYLLMRLPGEEKSTFLILQPFVPASREDKQRNLTAFMVARGDPNNYGEITAFVMPRGQLIDGPALADAHIAADPAVSEAITKFNQQGSRVLLGNILVVPVDKSLLYIRPLYVTSERNELPEFKKAIVVYAEKVAMRDTLQEALSAIFGSAPATLEKGPQPTPSAPPEASATVQQLLDQADAAFAAADAALRQGNLAEYDRLVKQGVALVRQARAAQSQRSGSTTTSTTATTQPNSA